ncbi:synaptosomal-associated protein 25-like isoform 1-T1 [Vipera latastei]
MDGLFLPLVPPPFSFAGEAGPSRRGHLPSPSVLSRGIPAWQPTAAWQDPSRKAWSNGSTTSTTSLWKVPGECCSWWMRAKMPGFELWLCWTTKGLDRIEDGLDQIIQDMKEAEKNLSDMAKCCGLFVCPCAKLKNLKAMETSKAASGNTPDVVSQQPIMMTAGTQMTMSGPFIQRIMKDDVEDEIEQNLTQVDSMLSNLRSMAVDMSNEIDVQSKQVENIKEKAVANVISINEANNQTTKMLKKA